MSNIDTSKIDVKYPIPGTNNSTQGFRDNFSQIKRALDVTRDELQDIQQKGLFKSGLSGVVLDNDANNTVVANVQTRAFRSSLLKYTTNASGNVIIDVSKADVHVLTIDENSTFTPVFAAWAPNDTQQHVDLVITFKSSLTSKLSFAGTNVDVTKTYLENFDAAQNCITAPNGVTTIKLRFSTIDCGTTITVQPNSRPYKTFQVDFRSDAIDPVGLPGDVPGTMFVAPDGIYVCTGVYNGTTSIWRRTALFAID